jgi:tRNA pseudouridine13 synthase
VQIPPLEKSLGMELYSTDFNGVGGKLKQQFEDFIVEEISLEGEVLVVEPEKEPTLVSDRTVVGEQSRFIHFEMQKMGLSTMDVSKIIAAELKLPQQLVGYAGLKDKRAVSTQLMSVPKSARESLQKLLLSRIEIRNLYYSKKPIEIGDLWGNRFTILVRNIDVDCETAANLIEDIRKVSLLNYFGVQRFGVTRPITHLIGLHLIKEEYETALRIMLTTSSEFEPDDLRRVREELKDDLLPTNTTLATFPESLRYEREVMKSLINQPENYTRAISKIPQRMQTLFVHSYQSYLFNRLISLRKKKDLPIDTPVPGDFIIELDQPHSGRDSWLFTTERNLEERIDQTKSGQFGLAAPLPGYSTKTPPGEPSDCLNQMLKEEGLDLLAFRNSQNRYLDSAGGLHLTSTIPYDLHTECVPEGLKLSFRLRKGSYATVVLREVMKNHPLNRV